jgi:hypothetical protein
VAPYFHPRSLRLCLRLGCGMIAHRQIKQVQKRTRVATCRASAVRLTARSDRRASRRGRSFLHPC